MLYIFIFLILSSSICIYSKKDWETFYDRLDLLITESYLIIQCNENEIQIIHFVTTFEELQSNLKCTNKDNLLEHGIQRVQIIDFNKLFISCKSSKFRLNGRFHRVKKSLDKNGNEVDWPFVHTPFTKEIEKTDPIKMKFFDNEDMEFTLSQISVKELSNVKQSFFIYLDFVNRPMICRIRVNGLRQKTNGSSCKADIVDEVNEPICYYKVDEQTSLSHEEFSEIVDKIIPYVKNIKSNYTYISDINHFIDSNNHHGETNSTEKGKKSQQLSSRNKNEKQLNSSIIIIIIIVICLIVIIIGIILFYKKNSKEEDNESSKQKSDSSNESQSSNKSDSVNSQKDSSVSPLKQKTKRAATNWYKLDEDI